MGSHVNGPVDGPTQSVPVITWDYQFAPNAQKARNLLNATGIPFQVCEQPFVLPRPIMKDLGITYRRIPVNSIGKDVYCDNRIFLEAVQSIFPDRALPRTPADAAYEQFGYRSFWVALPIVNASLITPALAKDREKLFAVFSREDFATLKPNGLAEMKCLLDVVENEFLSHGKPWIAGDRCGVADIHAIWIIKWAFETLEIGKEPGFSREDFPRVYRWIEGLPKHIPETEPEKMDAETAKSKVLAAGYAAKEIGVDPIDPTGLKAGTEVAVGTNDDAKPNNSPQVGKLVGLSRREIVVELENGLRMHFPRIGYVVNAV